VLSAATVLPLPPRRRQAAAAKLLLQSRCALPQLCHRQAAANVALSLCHHRCSIRAAAIALPPSHFAPLPRFVLPPPPLTLPPCRRQASANVALLGCCHCRRRAVGLPPPPQHPHRCHRATTVELCTPATLCNAATAADAAAAKLPLTSRCHAAANAAASALLPLRCRGRAVRCRRCASRCHHRR